MQNYKLGANVTIKTNNCVSERLKDDRMGSQFQHFKQYDFEMCFSAKEF